MIVGTESDGRENESVRESVIVTGLKTTRLMSGDHSRIKTWKRRPSRYVRVFSSVFNMANFVN